MFALTSKRLTVEPLIDSFVCIGPFDSFLRCIDRALKVKISSSVRHGERKYGRQFLALKILKFLFPILFFCMFALISTSDVRVPYKGSFDSFFQEPSIQPSKGKISSSVRHVERKYWLHFFSPRNFGFFYFWFNFLCIFSLITKRLTLEPRINAHSIHFFKWRRQSSL